MNEIQLPGFLLIVPSGARLTPETRKAIQPALQLLSRALTGQGDSEPPLDRALFQSWYRRNCVIEQHAMCSAAVLLDDFNSATGLSLSQKKFGGWLTDLGHDRHKRMGIIWRTGIRLSSAIERGACERTPDLFDGLEAEQ